MPNHFFRFKQFTVWQDRCAMKVSTDACLFGAWAGEGLSPAAILDIGTGTGLLGLMLAQRFPAAFTDAVEIDIPSAEQASENVSISPFSSRIAVHQSSVQAFAAHTSKQYDLIVSNPPYFRDHLKSADTRRNAALHTDHLSFDDLLSAVTTLLLPSGYFALILPPVPMSDFMVMAAEKGLYAVRRCAVYNKPGVQSFRHMVLFSANNTPVQESSLFIKDQVFAELMSAFYL